MALKYGCSTLLWGGHSLETALEGIKAAGYEAIELCSIPGMGANHLPDDASDADVAALMEMIEDHGLAIDSVGASTNLLNPEARERFLRVMERAAKAGAPAIATGPGGVSDDEESFAETVRTIDDLARRAAALGVKLALKPHHSSAAYNTPTALRLMAEVDTQWVHLNFDASHILRAGEDPVESLRQLAAHVGNARIRDAKTVVKGIPPLEDQVCGGGLMDLPGLVREMRGIEQLKFVVLEIVGANGLPVDSIQSLADRSIRYLRAIV